MDRLLPIFGFLSLAVAVTHAALLPSQLYWNTLLPHTPMPSAIQELLNHEVLDEKADTSANVRKAGVDVNAVKGKPGGTIMEVGKGGISVNVGGKRGTGVTVGKGVVSVVFYYQNTATEDQIHNDPTVTLFFLEKDLYPGTKMNLHFTRTTTGSATFLPRGTANSIPFSSSHLPEILTRLSIQPNSLEAESMKQTLEECEAPPAVVGTRHCATSLESMVDFSTTSLGTRQVNVVSTVVDKEGTPKQNYTIASSGVETLVGDKAVACHPGNYAYPVFNCHLTRETTAYVVLLVGEDGTKAEAVAVCHRDTSAWNPKYEAFQVLKVLPGGPPICHFLPVDHIVWSPSKTT